MPKYPWKHKFFYKNNQSKSSSSSESGRTLLEMMFVLCTVGLISAAGVGYYMKAYTNLHANDIMDNIHKRVATQAVPNAVGADVVAKNVVGTNVLANQRRTGYKYGINIPQKHCRTSVIPVGQLNPNDTPLSSSVCKVLLHRVALDPTLGDVYDSDCKKITSEDQCSALDTIKTLYVEVKKKTVQFAGRTDPFVGPERTPTDDPDIPVPPPAIDTTPSAVTCEKPMLADGTCADDDYYVDSKKCCRPCRPPSKRDPKNAHQCAFCVDSPEPGFCCNPNTGITKELEDDEICCEGRGAVKGSSCSGGNTTTTPNVPGTIVTPSDDNQPSGGDNDGQNQTGNDTDQQRQVCPKNGYYAHPVCCLDGLTSTYGQTTNRGSAGWNAYIKRENSCREVVQNSWYIEQETRYIYEHKRFYDNDHKSAGSWKVIYDLENATRPYTAIDYYRDENGNLQQKTWYPESLEEVEDIRTRQSERNTSLLKNLFGIHPAFAAESVRSGTTREDWWNEPAVWNAYKDAVECAESGDKLENGRCVPDCHNGYRCNRRTNPPDCELDIENCGCPAAAGDNGPEKPGSKVGKTCCKDGFAWGTAGYNESNAECCDDAEHPDTHWALRLMPFWHDYDYVDGFCCFNAFNSKDPLLAGPCCTNAGGVPYKGGCCDGETDLWVDIDKGTDQHSAACCEFVKLPFLCVTERWSWGWDKVINIVWPTSYVQNFFKGLIFGDGPRPAIEEGFIELFFSALKFILLPDIATQAIETIDRAIAVAEWVKEVGPKAAVECRKDKEDCCKLNHGHMCSWGEETYCVAEEDACCPEGAEETESGCSCPDNGDAFPDRDESGNITSVYCCPGGKLAIDGDVAHCCIDDNVPTGEDGAQICCPPKHVNIEGQCCPEGVNRLNDEGDCCLLEDVHGHCCATGVIALDGDGECCQPGEKNIKGICCPAGVTLVDHHGSCCEEGATALNDDGYCCRKEERNLKGTCCHKDITLVDKDGHCCGAKQILVSGYCCDDGVTAVDEKGNCCGQGQINVSGKCCSEGTTSLDENGQCASDKPNENDDDDDDDDNPSPYPYLSDPPECPNGYAAGDGRCCEDDEELFGDNCCPSGSVGYVYGHGCCTEGHHIARVENVEACCKDGESAVCDSYSVKDPRTGKRHCLTATCINLDAPVVW